MLSKIHSLILGIIAEKPLNPYEITKLLDYIHIREWFPVAASSVYATIKTLNQKDYITGEGKKEGNMPEKTIYSITEAGKKELLASLKEYLGSIDIDPVKFNIAGFMICHVEKQEALKILNERLAKLRGRLQGISGQFNYLQTTNLVPYLGLTVVRHNIYLIEVEIKTTEELIAEVQKNNDWNHFLVLDIKCKGAGEYGNEKNT